MSLQLAPIEAELLSWTYSDEPPPQRPGNIFFVNLASISINSGMDICVRLQPHTRGCSKPVVALGVAGFEMLEHSAELGAFLGSLPAWVAPTPFVASYRFAEV